MTSLGHPLAVLRQAATAGISDFTVLYTWRSWILGWLSRVLAQVAFFALIGRLLQSPDATRYLLVGNAVLMAVLESTFVIAFTSWERRTGMLPLLVAAPTSTVLVFCGRNLPWVISGTVSASIALFALAPVFGVSLAMPAALLAVPLIATVSASAYALGLFLAAIVLRMTELRNIVGNLAWWAVALFAGVQVPVTFWPEWVQALATALPATHGLRAIRAATDGELALVPRDVSLEIAVGAGWLVLAVLTFRYVGARGRRHGWIASGD
jgi:ABC-2 type transport system permease protein